MKDKSRKQTTLHSFFVDLTKDDQSGTLNSTRTTHSPVNNSALDVIDLCDSDSEEEVVVLAGNNTMTSKWNKRSHAQIQMKAKSNSACRKMVKVEDTQKDDTWLKSPILTEKNTASSCSSFITPMDALPTRAAQSISQSKHKSIVSPSSPLESLTIPKGVCCCCFCEDVDDILVICEKCGLCFHQSCYRIPEIPKNFCCDVCRDEDVELDKTPRDIKCQLCWRSNGAYKCAGERVEFMKGFSQTKKVWVHVICAVGVGLTFDETTKSFDISTLDKKTNEARGLECILCKKKQDFPMIRCSGATDGEPSACQVAIHPICLASLDDSLSCVQRRMNKTGRWEVLCADHIGKNDQKLPGQVTPVGPEGGSGSGSGDDGTRKSPIKKPKELIKDRTGANSAVTRSAGAPSSDWIDGGWMADPNQKKRQRSTTQFFRPSAPTSDDIPPLKKTRSGRNGSTSSVTTSIKKSDGSKSKGGKVHQAGSSGDTTDNTGTTVFNRGDLVQAQWYGATKGFEFGTCWFNGRIEKTDKRKGTYTVQYLTLEGHLEDLEDNVPASKIKMGHSDNCKCSMPDKCQRGRTKSKEKTDIQPTGGSKDACNALRTKSNGTDGDNITNKKSSKATRSASLSSSGNKFVQAYKILQPRKHRTRDYCLTTLYEDVERLVSLAAEKAFSSTSLGGGQNLAELTNFFVSLDDPSCQQAGYGFISRVLHSYGGKQLFAKHTQTMLKKLYHGMVMSDRDGSVGCADHIFLRDFFQCFLSPIDNLLKQSIPTTCNSSSDMKSFQAEAKKDIEWLPTFRDISTLIDSTTIRADKKFILGLSCIASLSDTSLPVLAVQMLKTSARVQNQEEMLIWQEMFTQILIKAYTLSVANNDKDDDDIDALLIDSVLCILASILPYLFADISNKSDDDRSVKQETNDLYTRIRHWNKECASKKMLPNFVDRLTNVSTMLMYPCLLAANSTLRETMDRPTPTSINSMDIHLLKVFKDLGGANLSQKPIVYFDPVVFDSINVEIVDGIVHPIFGVPNLFNEAIQSVHSICGHA